jgi:hypothetical protein
MAIVYYIRFIHTEHMLAAAKALKKGRRED